MLTLALLPVEAAAREGQQYRQSPDALLESRDREILHAGENPLALRGVDQGPDGFRSGTPALQRGDVKIAMVDAEELRNRRLAMYEGGARFDSPVALREVGDVEGEVEAAAPTAPDEPATEQGGGSGKYAFIGVFAVACGLAAHFFLRRR